MNFNFLALKKNSILLPCCVRSYNIVLQVKTKILIFAPASRFFMYMHKATVDVLARLKQIKQF